MAKHPPVTNRPMFKSMLGALKRLKCEIRNQKLRQQGITLLLVIILLSAVMSIGLEIFNIVIGELKISGEISDSFIAFYATDQDEERMLYLDRVVGPAADGFTIDDGIGNSAVLASGGCAKVIIYKTPDSIATGCKLTIENQNLQGITTCIRGFGQYRCGSNPPRVVKRGFIVIY